MDKLKIVLAVLIILVGIVGIFFPIIPGIALICFGIYLISPTWLKDKLRKLGIRKKFDKK